METESILCQSCGLEAPTKFVEFNQNIGMLLARQRSFIKGNLCKNCVHSHFWKKTLVTLGIGWLGTISLILAPVFIIMNVVHYLASLGMPTVPPGAIKPFLTAGPP
ncbi:MAG TPA: hypothetical protein VFC46_18200 [Humisphaera sp.]|nr:hypothetical protein [Humisphaera sp.]